MSEANILVVDDEPEVCEMIADWLGQQAEWTVDYTTEPLRALQQVGQGNYDLLLTDLRMPEMNGLELARQARGLRPRMSIIAITGHATVPSSVEALRLGFADYLQKPFRMEDIRSAICRALALRAEAAGESRGAATCGESAADGSDYADQDDASDSTANADSAAHACSADRDRSHDPGLGDGHGSGSYSFSPDHPLAADVTHISYQAESSEAGGLVADGASAGDLYGSSGDSTELAKRLDLVSRELTLMQMKMAGRVAEMEKSEEVAKTLSGQRDLQTLMSLGLMLLQKNVPAEDYALLLMGAQPNSVTASAVIDGEDVMITWSERRLSRGVVRAALKRRQVALIEDLAHSMVTQDVPPSFARHGSLLLVPVSGEGRAQAVVLLRRPETGLSFGLSDVRRIQKICDEIGRALEAANAFRRQQQEAYDSLRVIVDTVDALSPQSEGHSRRVSRQVAAVGRRLGLDDSRIIVLEMAGWLHDIGKIFLPRELLTRRGKLSAAERATMAEHCERGWLLLEPLEFLKESAALVRCHHGVGGGHSEAGVVGDNIEAGGRDNDDGADLSAALPVERQIIAAAEIYDELTHQGDDGVPLTHEEAVARLRSGRECQIHSRILAALDRQMAADC